MKFHSIGLNTQINLHSLQPVLLPVVAIVIIPVSLARILWFGSSPVWTLLYCPARVRGFEWLCGGCGRRRWNDQLGCFLFCLWWWSPVGIFRCGGCGRRRRDNRDNRRGPIRAARDSTRSHFVTLCRLDHPLGYSRVFATRSTRMKMEKNEEELFYVKHTSHPPPPSR